MMLSPGAKRLLCQVLSNAARMIEADEIRDAYGIGCVSAHLAVLAIVADDEDRYELCAIGDAYDVDISAKLQECPVEWAVNWEALAEEAEKPSICRKSPKTS